MPKWLFDESLESLLDIELQCVGHALQEKMSRIQERGAVVDHAVRVGDLRKYGIIIAAFFTVSIAYAVRYGYGMLLPGMLETMRISKTEAGLISASYFVVYTLGSPVLGLLADRCSARLLLTVFPALLALGALFMGIVTTVLQAALAFALAGLGHAACWAPVVSLVQRWADHRRRGTALAIATMGSSVGIIAWGLWLPVVVEQRGYRAGWLLMGLFGCLVVVLNGFLIRNPPGGSSGFVGSETPGPHGPAAAIYRNLFADRRFWLAGIAYAGVGFTVMVPFTFLGVYAVQELHLPHGAATRMFAVIAGAGLGGKLLLGMLSDRMPRVPVMASSSILLGLGCWGVVHLAVLWGKYLAIVLIGLGFGSVWPLYAAAAVDLFPKSMAGSVIGLWTVFLGIGSIAAPVLCGWLIDASGSAVPAFDLAMATGLLSVVMLFFLAGKEVSPMAVVP